MHDLTLPLAFAIFAGLLLETRGSSAAPQPTEIEVGRPFPDLELPTIDGERLRLTDLRGKPLLLFEFASW